MSKKGGALLPVRCLIFLSRQHRAPGEPGLHSFHPFLGGSILQCPPFLVLIIARANRNGASVSPGRQIICIKVCGPFWALGCRIPVVRKYGQQLKKINKSETEVHALHPKTSIKNKKTTQQPQRQKKQQRRGKSINRQSNNQSNQPSPSNR